MGSEGEITVALEQSAIRDMLTDIMHLCKAGTLHFNPVHRTYRQFLRT